MKKHFVLSMLASFLWGAGFTVQQLGIKGGLGFWPTIIIFISTLIFYVIIAFTSMEKVKKVLYAKKDEKIFEFENEEIKN